MQTSKTTWTMDDLERRLSALSYNLPSPEPMDCGYNDIIPPNSTDNVIALDDSCSGSDDSDSDYKPKSKKRKAVKKTPSKQKGKYQKPKSKGGRPRKITKDITALRDSIINMKCSNIEQKVVEETTSNKLPVNSGELVLMLEEVENYDMDDIINDSKQALIVSYICIVSCFF
jgi:hypothetical protein